MKMIFYTGIQKNSNYLINILHCILIKTEMQYCNNIGIVYYYFLNIHFCALVTIKLNVSLVYFFIWYMVFYPTRSLGGRGEALVRALVLHQCGLGSGLGM